MTVTVKSTSNVTYGNLKNLKWVCVGVLAFVILFFRDINHDNEKRETLKEEGRQSEIVISQMVASGGVVPMHTGHISADIYNLLEPFQMSLLYHADVITQVKLFIPLGFVGSIACVLLNVNTRVSGGTHCPPECCLVTCRLPITTGSNTVFPGGSRHVNGSLPCTCSCVTRA